MHVYSRYGIKFSASLMASPKSSKCYGSPWSPNISQADGLTGSKHFSGRWPDWLPSLVTHTCTCLVTQSYSHPGDISQNHPRMDISVLASSHFKGGAPVAVKRSKDSCDFKYHINQN